MFLSPKPQYPFLMSESLDPRMNRVDLPYTSETSHSEAPLMQWQNYEVFQQQKRGEQHIHVGAIHAANPELALILAKEQFGRREQCANLWVVRSSDVYATSYDDADMFLHAFDKSYREGDGYKVRMTIDSFKADLDARLKIPGDEASPTEVITAIETPSPEALTPTSNSGWKTIQLPASDNGDRKIFVKK